MTTRYINIVFLTILKLELAHCQTETKGKTKFCQQQAGPVWGQPVGGNQ